MHRTESATLADIFRNVPGHPEWHESFYGRLAEYGFWDIDEFWRLHAALVDVAREAAASDTIDRELALAVCALQQGVLQSVSAHYDANDTFRIELMSDRVLYSFVERFELAILGVFSGDTMPESAFDLVNPLVRDG